MNPSLALSYECPACRKTFAATITVPYDPKRLIADRDRARLRAVHALGKEVGERAGRVTPDLDDPVEETELELLESMAVAELEYATCPGCGQRNPAGVANVRNERRASRAGVAGFFALVALASYFAPSLAYLVPAVAVSILVVSIVVLRKTGAPIPWARLVVQALLPLALAVVPYRWPRWAFVVPITFSVLSLVQRSSSDDERFVRAAERVRFHDAPYREPGR